MAIQTLKTIKNWFRTGLKPTQAQFWDTWDSFRHKNEKVPVKDVEGIDELLNSKTDESDFKTINGESLLGSGDIDIRSDIPSLQNISDKHQLSIYTNTGLKINNSTNGAYTEIKAEQIETRDDEGHFSTILPGHGYFKFPNKTRDLFTIATTTDITLSNAIQGGSSWNGVYFTSPLESYQSNLYISSEGTKISYGTEAFSAYVDTSSGGGFSSGTNMLNTGKNYLVQLQGQLGLRLSTSGNGNTVGALKSDNLTAERTFQLPDYDGTLATRDDVQETMFKMKGVYKSNEEAIAGGLSKGDYYRTPITSNSKSSLLAVVVEVPPTMILTFTDINDTASNKEITDINDVSQWNNAFSNGTDVLFSSIEVDLSKNSAKFIVDGTVSDSLNLSNFKITNVELINFDGLINLTLNLNNITSLDNFAFPSTLQVLFAENNLLTSFTPSEHLPHNIQRLHLATNQITQFELFNQELSELYYIDLGSNQIATFNPTSQLPSGLQLLFLGFNEIINFNPALPLPTRLKVLDLQRNKITSFNPDIILPDLDTLILGANKITNFDPVIHALPNTIKSLFLYSNLIVNFDPTNNLPSELTTLNLDDNKITNFNPTLPLPPGLNILLLRTNLMTSFNPVATLPPRLNEISIGNNPITTASWNTDTTWISVLENGGHLDCASTTDTVKGTITETLLLAKNWTITS